MNTLEPIDTFLDNWKNWCIENIPALYKEMRDKIKQQQTRMDNGEIKYREYARIKTGIEQRYGRIVCDWGDCSKPNNPYYNEFLNFLNKEAEAKKTKLIARCNDKIGGISGIEWLEIGRTGELEGIITGPEGRLHLHAVLAGGYNIQCLHVRFLMNKIK